MYPANVQCLVVWLALSFLAFSFAAQKPAQSCSRYGITLIYLFCAWQCLIVSPRMPGGQSQLLTKFIFGQSMYCTGILFQGHRYLHIRGTHSLQRLRGMTYFWTDFRGIPRSLKDSTSFTPFCTSKHFACNEVVRILFLILGAYCALKLFILALRSPSVDLDDFATDKQGFLPPWPIHPRDIALRILITMQWTIGSYLSLKIAHRISAVLFVSILRLDHPSEWPPLFGSIADACSLRGFWGRFWHHLHVKTFAYFTPRLLSYNDYALGAILRAVWIFTLSALCHTIVSALTIRKNTLWHELRFWALNCLICSFETLCWRCVGQYVMVKGSYLILIRWLGYVWVFTLLICMSPDWQYPEIYRRGKGVAKA